MSDYETDFLVWSEHQADALRRRASNELDWENLAEEIEDLGNSQVRAVASHVVQALLHDLKAEAWPLSRDVPHWRAEARRQRDEAREAFTPAMKGRPELAMARLYRRALRAMPDTMGEQPPLPVPAECPFQSVDEVLADSP